MERAVYYAPILLLLRALRAHQTSAAQAPSPGSLSSVPGAVAGHHRLGRARVSGGRRPGRRIAGGKRFFGRFGDEVTFVDVAAGQGGSQASSVMAPDINTGGCPPGERAAAGREQQACQRAPPKADDEAGAGRHGGQIAFGIPMGVLDVVPDAGFTTMLNEI